jgi:acyl-CoA thioester hydrolase
MVVARAELDYLEPIYVGGIDLDVAINVSRIGTSSFDLTYDMSIDGVTCARAKTVQVTVDMNTKKSRPLKAEEITFLSKYLIDSEESK